MRHGARLFLRCYLLVISILSVFGSRRAKRVVGTREILLTGTFHSENWVSSHVLPLAMSRGCSRVRLVTTYPLAGTDKIKVIHPPEWLVRLAGPVAARLMTFIGSAFRSRPDRVGGFHLLFNGLVAALVARLVGARSMYFCVGGPAEVLGGGIASENRFFEKLEAADPKVEALLLRAVSGTDEVITMGTRAVSFFRERGVVSDFHVVPGGIDGARFHPGDGEPCYDLVLAGRLVPIKRIDLFLDAVALARKTIPTLKAAIVGDGPLRSSLEARAAELGLGDAVVFAGQRKDVEDWYRKSRIFVLTSETEGLSLSMMEAMLTGLPAIVSRVGDLEDLVEDGVNGYLVEGRSGAAFAERFTALLSDPERLSLFSHAARRSAERISTANTVLLWDRILAGPSRD